jgi:hypothetical protein
MPTLAFLIKGPKSNSIIAMADEDFAQAVKDGWAIPVKGAQQRAEPRGPHKAAEAYLNRQPGYATREMRAAENPAPPPAVSSSLAAGDDPKDSKPGKKPAGK